ncbi:TPA: hypothetical protein ACQQJB_003641 [Pseudomonas aeruginosa]
MSSEKDLLRAELERQLERYTEVLGGEVTVYAAEPIPDKRPWRKRKNLLDKAFEEEVSKARKEHGGKLGMAQDDREESFNG